MSGKGTSSIKPDDFTNLLTAPLLIFLLDGQKNQDYVARGLKATIHNDNTSDQAKESAAERLEQMGAEVPTDYANKTDKQGTWTIFRLLVIASCLLIFSLKTILAAMMEMTRPMIVVSLAKASQVTSLPWLVSLSCCASQPR